MAEYDESIVLDGLDAAQAGIEGMTALNKDARARMLARVARLAGLINSLPEPAVFNGELPKNLWEILRGVAAKNGLPSNGQALADAEMVLKAASDGDARLAGLRDEQGWTKKQFDAARSLADAFRHRDVTNDPPVEAQLDLEVETDVAENLPEAPEATLDSMQEPDEDKDDDTEEVPKSASDGQDEPEDAVEESKYDPAYDQEGDNQRETDPMIGDGASDEEGDLKDKTRSQIIPELDIKMTPLHVVYADGKAKLVPKPTDG